MLYIEKIHKTEILSILLKINKRIISGLYDLFKDYLPNNKDNELNLKTKSLSWININHNIYQILKNLRSTYLQKNFKYN